MRDMIFNKGIRFALAAAFSMLLDPQISNAWWSVPTGEESTHHRLTVAGENYIAGMGGNADVAVRYGTAISSWTSGSEDDERAHANDGKRNDGPIMQWWRYALEQYRYFKFSGPGDPLSTEKPGAYYYVALMAHLTEDMGVPAHAYNIPHGWTGARDNMEQIAHLFYPNINPQILFRDPIKEVGENYDKLNQFTLDNTAGDYSSWRGYYNNKGNCGYWYGEPDKRLLKGYYAETCGSSDRFHSTWPMTTNEQKETIRLLLGASEGYGAGALLAISRSLPPLVRNLTIPTISGLSLIIDPIHGSNITFKILENRTSAVRITIKAVEAGQQCDETVIIANGQAWNNVLYPLSGPSNSTDLPYEATITLNNWKGEISGGGRLPDGPYWLALEVTDLDGNEVNLTFGDLNHNGVWDINEDEISTGVPNTENDTWRGFVIDSTPPAKPTNPKVLGGNGKAQIAWTAPTNPNGTAIADLAGYWIYYAIGSNNPSRVWVAAPATSYELTPLTNDKIYFVWLTAQDEIGNESEPSATVTVKPLNALWVHESGGPSGSGTSIRDALAAANSGLIKTVMVGPGNYSEPQLTIGRHTIPYAPAAITLMSERGPAETTIDGQAGIQIDAADDSRIIGFTIRDASRQGTGIECFFDQGVLISNNILIANNIGVYVGGAMGQQGAPETYIGIYNNVFKGNVKGIDGSNSYTAQTRVFNNIFQDNDYAIDLFNVHVFNVQYNDFFRNLHGNGVLEEGTSDGENDVSHNFDCSPNFKDTSSSPPDYHLGQGSCARNAGASFAFTDPVTKADDRWQECDLTKSRVDLGAFGGPFAYVDNNGNQIPDCDELRGMPVAVTMLQNTVDYPILLTALSPHSAPAASSMAALLEAGTPPDLAFNIVSGPDHGTLSGIAPALAYSPAPGYSGEDAFSFTVSGEIGVSEPALVSIAVKASNALPVATDRTIRLRPNYSVAVLLQGTDADNDELTYSVDSEPSWGTLQCLMPPDCAFRPDPNLDGAVSFTYHVNDGLADSPPAIVHLIVADEPGIEVTSPAGMSPPTNATSFTITWAETTPEASGMISLYRDWDAQGFDGELIVSDMPAADPTNAYTWDTSALSDGTFYVYATIQDAGGTALAYAAGPLIIDRTAPSVSAAPRGGTYGAAQSVTLSADEPATIYATVDGSAPIPSSPSYGGPIVVSESLTLRWIAVDAAGNQSAEDSAAYVIDTVPPAVSIDPLSDPWRQAAATLMGSMEAGATVTLATDQPASFGQVSYPSSGTWACAVSGLTDGPVSFTATAMDGAGHTASASIGTTVVVGVNRAPTVPVLLAPRTQTQVQTLQPELAVENSVDPDGDALVCEYEVYADAGMQQLLLSSPSVPAGEAITSWTVGADLPDNAWHWWRARACDGRGGCSDWAEAASFFVNTANDPPAPFLVSAPQHGADVAALAPELAVTNSSDLDGDALSYSFLVYSDEGLTQHAASVTGLSAGAGGTTTWIADPPLSDNTWYFWKAVVSDAHGAATETGAAAFFVNLANEPPGTPQPSSPAEGEELAALAADLTVLNAADPEADPISYLFELDAVETFDGPAWRSSGWLGAGIGTTAWALADLADNTLYHWRVKASDGLVDSDWAKRAFFTNTANDAPSAVTPLNPGAESWADSVTPRLDVSSATDADRDAIAYVYEIYGDPPLMPLAQAQTPEAFWVCSESLPDNVWYTWRAAAIDEHGLAGPWSAPSRFFVNNNGIDDPPSITVTEPAADYALAGGSFEIRWVDADPDSNAAVSLYYDSDSAGEDGTPIANALAEDPDSGDNDAYAWDVSALPPGRYWVYAAITDGPTTRTSYSLGSVTIDSPPVASAGPDRMGTVGQVLSFSAGASTDPDGMIVSYSWNWGDGTIDGAGVSATHTYAVAGAYTVTLTVTDNLGAASTDTAAVAISAAPVNLALNQPARASSTQSGSSHTAAKAVDGSTATSWMSDKSSKAQWVQVDLGSSTSISKVKVFWPATYFARAFRIETSTSGTFWTTRYSTSSSNGSVTNANFATVSARFVRVYCTAPNGSPYYSVSELEVYK